MTAYPRGTGLGSPRNSMPGLKPYRWRGKLTPPDPEPEPRRKANSPGNRRERQAALAGMRVNTQPGHPRLRDGEVTCEQAARILGVKVRTIMRDLRAIRETSP